MAWRLSGRYIENCNCDTVCPCTTSELTRPADEERCLLFCAFHVDKGEIQGTGVGGLNVAAVFDAPRVMSEGGWRAGFIVDSAATDEQAEKLRRVFPAGELTVATATRSRFAGHFGIEFSHGDKNGHWTSFSWAG